MVKAMSELRNLTIIAIYNAYPVNLTKEHEEKYKDMYVDYLNRGVLSVAYELLWTVASKKGLIEDTEYKNPHPEAKFRRNMLELLDMIGW
jgi:hypothetical protein